MRVWRVSACVVGRAAHADTAHGSGLRPTPAPRAAAALRAHAARGATPRSLEKLGTKKHLCIPRGVNAALHATEWNHAARGRSLAGGREAAAQAARRGFACAFSFGFPEARSLGATPLHGPRQRLPHGGLLVSHHESSQAVPGRARPRRASKHTKTHAKVFWCTRTKRTICCCARNCCCACGMACAGSAYCGNPPAGGACFLSMVVACRARAPATTSKVSVSDPPHHAHHGSTPRAGRRPPARHGALSPGGPLHTHTNPPARTPRHAEVCLASADWLTRS